MFCSKNIPERPLSSPAIPASTWVVMATAFLGQGNRAKQLFDLLNPINPINPINHAGAREAVARYRVEPYVVAANVYGITPARN